MAEGEAEMAAEHIKKLPEEHPLHQEFHWAASMGFRTLELEEPEVEQYITHDILTEFTLTDNLLKVRSERGAPLEEVGEMLAEGNVLMNAKSFNREREVHKHIGDYVLFMMGIFPDYITHVQNRNGRKESLYKELNMGGFFVAFSDYTEFLVHQGKRSYQHVAEFDIEPYAQEVPLFKKLSKDFLKYLTVMSFVKLYLERLPQFVHLRSRLASVD